MGIFQSIAMLLAIALSFPDGNPSKESLYKAQKDASIRHILENLENREVKPGAVIASPTKEHPDYFFHWVRDGAITMAELVELFNLEKEPSAKRVYFEHLQEYVEFSRGNQLSKTLSGLGEPKFFVDGRPFDGLWGRPQNDGPALRAITLSRLINVLFKEGISSDTLARQKGSPFPITAVLEDDLSYVATHWKELNFDLWEEVKGEHFFTKMVQRRALIDGSKVLRRFGLYFPAQRFESESREIQKSIQKHFSSDQSVVYPTIQLKSGKPKASQLDVSILLGSIHGDAGDGFASPTQDAVLRAAANLYYSFQKVYAINSNIQIPGVAIGRYPEDEYFGGNPWFLATLAFAEFDYKVCQEFFRNEKMTINAVNLPYFLSLYPEGVPEKLKDLKRTYLTSNPMFKELMQRIFRQGDAMLDRVLYHLPRDGSGEMSEQFEKNSGYMISAENLTWSHAAFVSAERARSDASLTCLP